MLQSQFNLDHRLAELRQIGEELRLARAARGAARQGWFASGAVRALLRWSSASARPARLPAH